MRVPVTWLNLVHGRKRTLAALTGITMAIVLIFMQIGFYRAAYRAAVIVLDQFSFKLALISKEYVYFRQPGSMPRARLEQAYAVDGVKNVMPLSISVAAGAVRGLDAKREVAVLAVDPDRNTWIMPRHGIMNRELKELDTVILDTVVGPGYDLLKKGRTLELDGHRVTIADTYRHGPGFAGSALLITSDLTYARIFRLPDRNTVMLGLIDLAPGTDPVTARDRLNAILPDDVRAVTRDQLAAIDQHWTIDIKPVGIVFSSGLILAFIIGAVILYQVLATEVTNRLREFATLKAIGYDDVDLNVMVCKQAMYYAVLGFVPATLLSTLIYHVVRISTGLPTEMTAGKLIAVFVMASFMCVIAATGAIRKVSRADPADLF